MTLERFLELLDTCGSGLATWRAADRIAAERLIASDPAAAKAFEEARRFDGLIRRSLGADGAESEFNAIASRILAGLPEKLPAQVASAMKRPARPAPEKSWKAWTFRPAAAPLWPRVAALSFAAALGVTLGLFWAQKTMTEARQAAMTEEASADVTNLIFQTGNAAGTFYNNAAGIF